ncbi:MAG: hypothetical protein CTY18_03090 [Methylomonas sp.]|nr:MAG: hypothetical protein CTY18_03090 [Methylomonas sp.]
MAMTVEWIKLGLSVLNFVGLILGFFYVRLERKDTATTTSITELHKHINKRFDTESARISNLEFEVGRIPDRAEFDAAQERSRQEIVRIHERIDEINSGIKASQLMIGELIGITRSRRDG